MHPVHFIVILSLFVPTAIAMLALRFGPDSRPSYRSNVHTLAFRGMGWDSGAWRPR